MCLDLYITSYDFIERFVSNLEIKHIHVDRKVQYFSKTHASKFSDFFHLSINDFDKPYMMLQTYQLVIKM